MHIVVIYNVRITKEAASAHKLATGRQVMYRGRKKSDMFESVDKMTDIFRL